MWCICRHFGRCTLFLHVVLAGAALSVLRLCHMPYIRPAYVTVRDLVVVSANPCPPQLCKTERRSVEPSSSQDKSAVIGSFCVSVRRVVCLFSLVFLPHIGTVCELRVQLWQEDWRSPALTCGDGPQPREEGSPWSLAITLSNGSQRGRKPAWLWHRIRTATTLSLFAKPPPQIGERRALHKTQSVHGQFTAAK